MMGRSNSWVIGTLVGGAIGLPLLSGGGSVAGQTATVYCGLSNGTPLVRTVQMNSAYTCTVSAEGATFVRSSHNTGDPDNAIVRCIYYDGTDQTNNVSPGITHVCLK